MPVFVCCPVYTNVNEEKCGLKEICISVFEFRVTFTSTKNLKKNSFHDREFFGYRKK